MSIEKSVAAALEPIVEEVADLRILLEQVETTPGPAGRDADPEDVAKRLQADEEWAGRLRGAAGEPGAGIVGIERDGDLLYIRLSNEEVHVVPLPPAQAGENGKDGVGIKSLSQDGRSICLTYDDDTTDEFLLPEPYPGVKAITSTGGLMTVELTNGKTFDIELPRGFSGERGEDGIGIKDVAGKDDGVEVTLTNGDTRFFALPEPVSIEGITQAGPTKLVVAYSNGDQEGFDLPAGPRGETGVGVVAIKQLTPDEITVQLSDDTTVSLALPAGKDGRPGVGIKKLAQIGDRMIVELDDGSHHKFTLPKGDPGPQGIPGVGIKTVEQSEDGRSLYLTLDNDDEVQIELPAGPKGDTADAVEVAKSLAANAEFMAHVRGPAGERGERGEPGEPGEPGRQGEPADADEVAKSLFENPQFIDTVRGQPGLRGERGPAGVGIQIKAWVPGVYRAGAVVQSNLGQYFVAKQDTAADTSNEEEWERIGTTGFRWRKLKPAEESLRDGDIYIDSGSAFLWLNGKGQMLCQRGARGARGEKGERGERGQAGADGAQIVAVEETAKGIAFVRDDGELIELAYPELRQIRRALNIWEDIEEGELARIEQEKRGVPIRTYRGFWDDKSNYSRGDVVKVGRKMWLAVSDPKRGEFNDSIWTQFGGGGGGGSAGNRPPAASPFNVVPLSAMVPGVGAGDGDAYFAFQDRLLRIWDANANQWVFPAGVVQEMANEAAVRGSPGGQSGLLRYARAEGTLWLFNAASNQWETPSGAAVVANAAQLAVLPALDPGRLAYQADTQTLFVADGGLWNPVAGASVPVVPNVAALAALPNPQSGDLAFQSDIGDLMIYVGNQWVHAERFVVAYANQAALNAAAPVDNTIGFKQDTGTLYFRDNGAWVEIGGNSVISVASQAARYSLLPHDVSLGSLVFQSDTSVLWQYTGVTPVTAATIAVAASWTQITPTGMTGKVIEVADETALPAPQAAAADTSSPLYLIRNDLNGAPLNRLVWFDDTTPAPTVAVPNPPATGVWVDVTATTFLKALQTDPDTTATRRVGDLQATIQPDHAELKAFDGNVWQMLFSEDEIRSWIAAGSLFQGTIMPAPTTGGAIDLVELPVPSSQWKGYYWTWVGPPNYEIKSPAEHKADVVAAGGTWHDLSVIGGFVGTTAGSTLDLVWVINNNVNGVLGTERFIIVELQATTMHGQETAHVGIHGLDTDGTVEIAAKLHAAWIPGTLGMTSSVSANRWSLTPHDPTVTVDAMILHDGGTPMIGLDLQGETMQVGDWVQVVTDPMGGYRWAHVPSDLLSKLRGDRLYSIQPWAQGTWEVNSVVNYLGRLWRATRGVSPADSAPQLANVPITFIGNHLAGYPASVAACEVILGALATRGAAARNEYVVIDAGGGGTYSLPGGGTITANVGDAILFTGNVLHGVEGFVVVPGPHAVVADPAMTVTATPVTTAANPSGAIPVASSVQVMQQFTAGIAGNLAHGQRLVATQGFTVPAGQPWAGQVVEPGDTFWYTVDPQNGHSGWDYVQGSPLGAADQPPFVAAGVIPPHITSPTSGRSALDTVLADMVGNGLTAGDVITVSAAGSVGPAGINSLAFAPVNVGDWIEIVDPAAGTFLLHAGPYNPGGTHTVTSTARFMRSYSSSWEATGTDDISDKLSATSPALPDQAWGYFGGGGAKYVNPAWANAGNLAGTNLPNTANQYYYLIAASTNPLTWVVVPLANNVWPAQGTMVPYSAQVANRPPAISLSAAGSVPYTWADLVSDADLSSIVVGGVTYNIGVGQYFVVDEPTAAVPAGPGAANLVGQPIAAGDRLYITRLVPLRWQVVPAASTPLVMGLFYEGQQPADPATLTYNKPLTLTPPHPTPQITLPGLPTGASPWIEIPIEGNFHSVLTDLQLPVGGAPGNEVYFVALSAMAQGVPALYSWFNNAWTRLGGDSGGIQIVNALPAVHVSGDVFFHTGWDALFVSDGTTLSQINTRPTGPRNANDVVDVPQSGVFPWAAGKWARGTNVTHNHALWLATTEIPATTPAPGDPHSLSLVSVTEIDVWISSIGVTTDILELSQAGSYATVSGTGIFNPNAGTPLHNVSFADGDRVMWIGDARISGVSIDGIPVTNGFAIYPAGANLPATGTSIVVPYNEWQFMGWVGSTVQYDDRDATIPVQDLSTIALRPRMPGDMLAMRNQAGFPALVAISKDGSDWQRYHPNQITFDPDGASKPANADYPTQFNVAFANNEARITHVAARDLSWVPVAASAGGDSVPIGTVIMHASVTSPLGYLLCDGRAVPAGAQYDALRTIIGANVPDLTNQFVRGSGTQSQITNFAKRNDTTRRPRTSFTMSSMGQHRHSGEYYYKTAGSGSETLVGAVGATFGGGSAVGGNWRGQVNNIMAPDGSHTHSINGGGDSETAPVHVYLAFHIKY